MPATAYLDKYEDGGLVDEQTFDSVAVRIRKTKTLTRLEIIRDGFENIRSIQTDYGHLAGQEAERAAHDIEDIVDDICDAILGTFTPTELKKELGYTEDNNNA